MSEKTRYHTAESGLFWSTDRVMQELGVSRPTAYRMMHESGAASTAIRHLRVFAPDFIRYLISKEGNDAR